MNLLIKNMVSRRCIIIVKAELEKLGLHYTHVELGEVEIEEDLSTAQREELKYALKQCSLTLMDDKKRVLIEQIKNKVFELTRREDETSRTKFTHQLSKELHNKYQHLSALFSVTKGISLEQYIIIHKTERVKELIVENNLTLTEIAFKLNYSSSAHLSNQFKLVTGLTPSFFKKLVHKRLTLNSEEEVCHA